MLSISYIDKKISLAFSEKNGEEKIIRFNFYGGKNLPEEIENLLIKYFSS